MKFLFNILSDNGSKKSLKMKCYSRIMILGVWFGVSYQSYAQTTTENYVQATEASTELTGSISGVNEKDDIKKSIIYYDDFGRPEQEVTRWGSFNGYDQVSLIGYDGFGRQDVTYLPYPAGTTDGRFQSAAESGQASYYTNYYGSGEGDYAYSKTVFEPSPLNRVEVELSPGSSWVGSERGISYGYSSNQIEDFVYQLSSDESEELIFNSDITANAGTFYKNTITDEDGKSSMEFTNKDGQTILKRVALSSGTFTDTYYIYNERKQLSHVISPEGTKVLNDMDGSFYNAESYSEGFEDIKDIALIDDGISDDDGDLRLSLDTINSSYARTGCFLLEWYDTHDEILLFESEVDAGVYVDVSLFFMTAGDYFEDMELSVVLGAGSSTVLASVSSGISLSTYTWYELSLSNVLVSESGELSIRIHGPDDAGQFTYLDDFNLTINAAKQTQVSESFELVDLVSDIEDLLSVHEAVTGDVSLKYSYLANEKFTLFETAVEQDYDYAFSFWVKPTSSSGFTDAYLYLDNGTTKETIAEERLENLSTINWTEITFNGVLPDDGILKLELEANSCANDTYVDDISLSVNRLVIPENNAEMTLQVNDSDFLDAWAFQYKYDERNRMIEKVVPGAKPVYMVYDDRDRLVLTQDGNQRNDDEWLFTKYDAFNRPIMTGIIESTKSVEALEADINSLPFYESFSEGATTHQYTNNAYPQSANVKEYLTVTYYDNYDFTTATYVRPAEFSGTTVLPEWQQEVKGQVTGTMSRQLGGTNEFLTTVSFYDDQYRVIQVLSDNHLGGTDVISNQYDFVGNILQVQSVNNEGSNQTRILTQYDYDHMNRLLSATHKINNNDPILLYANEYNELGELIDKKLHSIDKGSPYAQAIDYEYNIRGWLRKINGQGLTGSSNAPEPSDLFSMELIYDTEVPNLTNN